MNMIHETLNGILSRGVVLDEDGKEVALHSSIRPTEGEFIASLISTHNLSKGLELDVLTGYLHYTYVERYQTHLSPLIP